MVLIEGHLVQERVSIPHRAIKTGSIIIKVPEEIEVSIPHRAIKTI